MKLRIDATPEELETKAPELVKSLGEILRPVSPEMADILEKAIPRKESELKFPVTRTLQKKTEEAYEKQMKLMIKDIGKVLDSTLINKSESPDYTPQIVDKDEEKYNQVKQELLGYYVVSDFEEGGPLHGYSTNQLIDLAREKRDAAQE